METESYQEFIKKPKHKLSLVMWLFINNNIVRQNTYLAFMAFDFSFSTLVIMCLYNQVGAIPLLSESIAQTLDFDVQPGLQMFNILIASLILAIIVTIIVLIVVKIPWAIYSSQKLIFQVISLSVTLMVYPLFGVLCLVTLDSFFNFQNQLQFEVDQGNSTQMNYVGLIAAIISTVGLAGIVYFGSYLFNLSVPNDKLPWASMSQQPALLASFFKLFLMISFKVRELSTVILYVMALIALLICIMKLYVIIYRAPIINDTVFNMTILFDCAHAHLLFFLLVTCILSGQPVPLYIICAVGFLPVTCFIGLYIKKQHRRHLVFDYLVSSQDRKQGTKDDGDETLLAYLGLVLQCAEQTDSTQQELVRLEQAHYTRCISYYDLSNERICSTDITDNQQIKSGLLASLFKFDSIECEAMLVNNNREQSVQEDLEGSQNISIVNFENFKRFPANNMKSNLQNNNFYPGPPDQLLVPSQNEEEIKTDGTHFTKLQPRRFSAPSQQRDNNEPPFMKQVSVGKRFSVKTTKGKEKEEENKQTKISTTLKLKNELEMRTSDREGRWAQLRYLVNHLFNYHLPERSKDYFKIMLLKVFFTFHVQNNPYLANFLLFSKNEDDEDIGFIEANFKLLHHKYFDDLIFQKQKQDEEASIIQNRGSSGFGGAVDLRSVLQVNQMLGEFDLKLEVLCENIHQFWENLVTQNSTQRIFIDGIQISDELAVILRLLNKIQDQQSNFETKTYIQMAQFYQMVVFKPGDSYTMIEKAKTTLNARSLQRRGETGGKQDSLGGSGFNSPEKCLIMARISVSEPMKIEFFNKNALKLLQYQQQDVGNLTINHIMPRFIAESHQHFIDEFMTTGKTRMINFTREIFIKQSSGTVVPIISNLFVNSMSRKHMVFIFEENTQAYSSDLGLNGRPQALLLANKHFKFGEISQNFQKITGVSQGEVAHLEKEMDRVLDVDDFIILKNFDQEIKSYREANGDNCEVEVTFVNVRQNFQQKKQTTSDSDISDQVMPVEHFKQSLTPQIAQDQSQTDQQYSFMMKITDVRYMGGRYEMYLISIRRVPRIIHSLRGIENEYNVTSLYKRSLEQSQKLEIRDGDAKYSNRNEVDDPSQDSTNEYEMASQISASSASNSSTSGTQTILSAYSQQTNSSNSPKTLKFLINLVLIIVVIMIVSSSVVLTLAQNSLDFAYNSINYSQSSFQSYDEISLMKLALRGIANIEQGYVPNTGPYIIDRFRDYRMMLFIQRRELRDDSSVILQSAVEEGSLAQQQIQCWYISDHDQSYYTNETLGTGLAIVDEKCTTLVAEGVLVNSIGKSVLPMFSLQTSFSMLQNKTIQNSTKLISQIEQDFYFILNNTNGPLSDLDIVFGPAYVQLKLNQIASQLGYLTGTSMGILVLIILSGFLILPLSGRIQNRISELMKLFFKINLNQKRDILEKIKSFQALWYAHKLQRPVKKEEKKQQEDIQRYINAGSAEFLDQVAKKIRKPKRKRNLVNIENWGTEYMEGTDMPLPSPTPLLDQNRNNVGTKPNKKISKAFNTHKNQQHKLGVFKNDEREDQQEEFDEEESHEIELKDYHSQESNEEDGEEIQRKERKRIGKIAKQKEKGNEGEKNLQEIALMEILQQQTIEFSKYIYKRKIVQSIIIVIILLILSSYYIAMYILSSTYSSTAVSCIRDYEAIFSRLSCHVNIISMYSESFFQGTNFTEDRFQAISNQIIKCMNAEQNYKQYIVGSSLPYMTSIMSLITQMESGVLCPMVAAQDSTPDNCLNMQAHISAIGMPAYLYGYMQTIQQMLLNLQQAIKSNQFDMQFAKGQLLTLHNYIDMMINLIYPNHVNIEDSIITQTSAYFLLQQPVVEAVFASYFSIIILITITSLLFIILSLKKEMIQSNRMLYIIDFDSLSEEERQDILRFLLKH